VGLGKVVPTEVDAGPAVRFGRDDFSDAHNSTRIEHLAVNNAGTGYAVELNYVLNADIFAVAVTAGSAGLVMNQVQFSRISGAASATAGTAMLIQNGYSFANTIQAIDLEVAEIGIAITSPYATGTTFARRTSTVRRRSSRPPDTTTY